MVSVATLIQYILTGNYLGLLQAVFVSAFLSADTFYGALLMLFTTPLYIRSKNLMFLVVIWILLGTAFLVALPMVAGLGLFLTIMGLGGVFFKLLISMRG